MLATFGGDRQLITAAHNSWIGLDPATGKLLWKLGVRQNGFNHQSITPVVSGDRIYAGANQRPTLALWVRKNGTDWTAEKLWETRDVTLSTSSPVLSGNRLYMVNEKRRGQLTVLDPRTGRTLWACPGDKGEHVTVYDAGKELRVFTIQGEMRVFRKGASELTEVAKYEVADSAAWASPAVSGNLVLVKGAESLTLWEVGSGQRSER